MKKNDVVIEDKFIKNEGFPYFTKYVKFDF